MTTDRPHTAAPISRRALLRGAVALGGLAASTTVASPAVASPSATTGGSLAAHHGPDVLLGWLDVVFIQVRDQRASPPSAARIYAACAVAAYEAVVAGAPGRRSLHGQLPGLGASPLVDRWTRPIDFRAAVNQAVARTLDEAFADRSATARAAIADHAASVHAALVAETGAAARLGARHGRAVGGAVARWLASDGYLASRGLSYTPPVGPGLWRATPPNFGTALEPHWWMVRPMAMHEGGECTPPPPLPFSTAEGSPFHQQAMVVHATSLTLTDDQRDTAMYWRDNPDGVTGLPAGHWMQIAAGFAAVRDLAEAAELLALTGVTVADAFTSCWVEKYRTNLLRPVTYIQDVIDPTWASFVNSPAFPEYTSGHSVGSGAAARVLSVLVGERSFTDHGAAGRGYTPRTYPSVRAAADEAATSRLYGGIHYPMAIEAGLDQGVHVADTVLARIRTRSTR